MTVFKKLLSRHRQWLLTVLGLTICFLAFNHMLVLGQAAANWDGDGYFFPYYTLVADFAQSLSFAHWDPWTNGGIPIAGDPQVGAYSPVLFVFGMLTGGSSYGFILYWLSLWFFGGLGILLFARDLETPAWAAGVIALGFLFCGFYMGDAEYTSWISSFSFLPWTVWRLDAALRTRRAAPVLQAAGLWGVSALHGYPGFTIMTGLFCGAWALARAVAPDENQRAGSLPGRVAFASASVAAVAIVGAVILAPTYFTFLFEGAGHHRRVETLSRTLATSGNDLAPAALSTFASPYLGLLKQYAPNLFPGTDVSSVSVYLGAFILVFALFATVSNPRNAWRWGLFSVSLLFLGLALGDALPLRGWLYDLLYPTRFFRHSSLIRGHAMFALAVLAMYGARDLARALQDGGTRNRKLFFAVCCATAGVAAIAFFMTFGSVPPNQRDYAGWGYLHLGVVWGGVLVTGAFVGFGSGRLRHAIPIAIVVVALADGYVASKTGGPVLMETDPARVKQWQTLDQHHVAATNLMRNGLRREESTCGGKTPCKSNYHLLVKTPSLDAFSTEKSDVHETMFANPVLRRAASGTDRVWFAREAAIASLADDEAIDALSKRSTELNAPVLVITPRDTALGQASSDGDADAKPIFELQAATPALTTVTAYTPDQLDLRVTVSENGWLLVTDRWSRSWSAAVNGVPVRLDVGNFLFRAVPVKAGENTISFRYEPPAFPWLVFLSWITAALALSAPGFNRFFQRSRDHDRATDAASA